MSREQQRYSIAGQTAAIAAYAAANGYEIIRSYADPARSGLRLTGRLGLQALLADVLRPDRDFQAVLVLDVSRWGRFQDLDQGAHYEFICRAAGAPVIYCVEHFDNDGSLQAALIKQLKRLMAAEYSRELSAKTKAAQLLQAKLGHRMGGPLIYGVRRVILDRSGRPRGDLARGVSKARSDHCVVLQPGSADELATVRWIFRRFLRPRATASSVARELNAAGVPYIGRRRWGPEALVRLLRHELMIGIYVYNRTSSPLKSGRVQNAPKDWIRVRVFDPPVPERLFARVQAKLNASGRPRSSDQMLEGLKGLLMKHGRLSAALIKGSPDLACVAAYQKRFGSLLCAYAAVGYAADQRLRSPVGWRNRRDCATSSPRSGCSAPTADAPDQAGD